VQTEPQWCFSIVSLVESRRSMDSVGIGAGRTDGMKDDPGLRVLPGDFCRMARDCRWPSKHWTAEPVTAAVCVWLLDLFLLLLMMRPSSERQGIAARSECPVRLSDAANRLQVSAVSPKAAVLLGQRGIRLAASLSVRGVTRRGVLSQLPRALACSTGPAAKLTPGRRDSLSFLLPFAVLRSSWRRFPRSADLFST